MISKSFEFLKKEGVFHYHCKNSDIQEIILEGNHCKQGFPEEETVLFLFFKIFFLLRLIKISRH